MTLMPTRRRSSHNQSSRRRSEVSRKREKSAIIDATCPYVRRLQELATGLSGRQAGCYSGKSIILKYGVSLLGRGQTPGFTGCQEENLLNKLDNKKPVSVLAQTTQQVSILNEIVEKLKETVPAVDIYNTICKATAMRQEAARKLAEMADVMIVIGSEKSSNTKKLAAVCRQTGTRTIQCNS